LPELVSGPALERANGYYQASALLTSALVGPPIGAALFVLNAGLPLVIDAVTFGLAAILVASVRRAVPAADPRPRRSLRVELVEGLRYLWGQHVLRTLAFLLLVVNFVGSGVVAILVLYVLDVLELPEAAFGWLVATYAVGGLAGAVLVPRIAERVQVFASVVAGGTLMGAGITLLGVWPSPGPAVVGVVLAGFGSVWWNVVTVSLRQRIVPRALLGRVTSVYRMIGLGAMPLGAAGAGYLAHQTDLQTPYVVLGLTNLLVVWLSAPTLRRRLEAVPLGVGTDASAEVRAS
jgi:predicted MFS family arabinose efflux permease